VPELLDPDIVELGCGLDKRGLRRGDLVLRVGDGGSVGREARLLETVASHVSIPIPKPRFVDEDAGVLGYELIAGQPLLGGSPPAGAAQRLGRFLRDLYAIDPATVADLITTEDAEPDAWLDGLDGPPDLVRILHATRPRPSPERVLAHADLSAEHILELPQAPASFDRDAFFSPASRTPWSSQNSSRRRRRRRRETPPPPARSGGG
jgi:aminoglycoside phosphotransferase (APT) family kinase protein